MDTKQLHRIFSRAVYVMVVVALAFSTTGGVFAQDVDLKVGLVFTETGLTDNSFNWMAYQGLLQAQTDLGVTISDYTPASSDEYGAVLQQCADDGNGLCIAVGFSYGDSLANAAMSNPDTKWAIVDWSYDYEIPNARGLRFNEKQAGYLAGVLAGNMTSSNVVGAVGGMEIPPVVAFLEGYRNGAQCTNPDVSVLATYTGTFSDPDLGAITAEDMIGQGADVVFGAAGSTGNGAILYSAQNGQWAIGVDSDQYQTVFGNGTVAGSDKLLSSAMKRVDHAVYQTIADYVNGDFSSGTILYDLAMDGVGLAPFHETDASIPQEVKDELDAVKQGIIDGTINIDDACEPPPPPTPWLAAFPEYEAVDGWEWPEGATVTLTIDNAPGLSWSGVAAVTTWGDQRTIVSIGFGDDYNLQVGDVVTLTDEFGTSTTHTVQNLSVTEVNAEADTVSGTADIGAVVQVWPHGFDQDFFIEDIVEDGTWSADFGALGFTTIEETGGRSQIVIDGNATAVDWSAPPPPPVPFIWADPLCECINGWDWSVGDTITIRVFDQDNNELILQNPTRIYEEGSGAAFELWAEGIDLQPGYRITMTNGVITKELLVTKLVVKEMNPVANTISGIYDPAFDLVVYTGSQEPLNLEFDGDKWIATFESVPLDGFGEAYQPDEDSDKTGMGWDGVPRFMRYDIYAFDVESGTNTRITTLDGTGEYNPSWSPFGKKVAHDVVYWDGFQAIYITDVATGSSHPLKGAVDGGNDAAWSPNGLWIAFDRRWVGDENIYIVPFTGGQRRLVRENAVSASWSPSGLRIVFQDLADGGKVKTVGLLGNVVITVADYGENPAWSPDGKWIAYQRDGDIWKVRVGLLGSPLGDPIQLTSGPFWDDQPTWSGDSQSVVYHAGMNEDYDLWSVSASGGEPTWLNGTPEFGDYDPAYARNSPFIAYASISDEGQAARQWGAAFTYDYGSWASGDHSYFFEDAYSVPALGGEITPLVTFTVSDDAPQYDGYVLLRGLALRARVGEECPVIDPLIRTDQATRFHYVWMTDSSMTYDEALAHFNSMTVTAFWDDGQSANLVRHEIFPWSTVDWAQYICAGAQP